MYHKLLLLLLCLAFKYSNAQTVELYVKGKITETIPFSQISTVELRKGLLFLHLKDSALNTLNKIDVPRSDNTFLLFSFRAGTNTIKDTVPIFSYTTDFFPAGFPSALVWEDRRIIKDKKVFIYIDNEEVRPGQDRIKGFVDRLIDTLVFKSDGKL